MIVAATGHRPTKLGGYGGNVWMSTVSLALRAIDAFEPSLIITGMALGWDQAVAEAAGLCGVPYHAYIPFPGQELIWPADAQASYDFYLAQAAKVRIVSQVINPGGEAGRLMQVRNRAMVDDCNLVAALWDGSPGGTANCCRYADRVGRPVANLWPDWLGGSSGWLSVSDQ